MSDFTAGPADDTLVSAARRGDLAAFNLLVDRYERLVYAICLRLLREPALAEDAAQETFIRAYGALEQYHGPSLRAWLARIATNRCYDLLRGVRRHPLQSLEAEPGEREPHWSLETPPEDPFQQAVRSELGARLIAALEQLPLEQRVVVLLCDVHGYDYEEIAAATEVAVGTVKSRLSRARARLREILRADQRSRELFEGIGRHYFDDDPGARRR